jgi:hypothetical protein
LRKSARRHPRRLQVVRSSDEISDAAGYRSQRESRRRDLLLANPRADALSPAQDLLWCGRGPRCPAVDDPKKRAVGFKLSEGMEVPAELASRFKFATQKSKLAGTIRGSYFAFENDY